jgi:hypothetical protein
MDETIEVTAETLLALVKNAKRQGFMLGAATAVTTYVLALNIAEYKRLKANRKTKTILG